MTRFSWPRRALVITTAAATITAALAVSAPRPVRACGCFAPPDPTVPIVQTGERILFARKDGVVTAHIQIQYRGDAAEFGWLLPLPAVPTMEVGTDELFTQLIAQTQPRYRLTAENTCDFGPPDTCDSCGSAADAAASEPPPGGGPLVVRDTVGPYDYAVLRADSKDEMLAWLSDNGFFIPAGTEDVVGPYIRPNAYFLALKLRKGQSVGDLQPVVVHYASELPMIPLVLTSVAADPNMGILVWVLGEHRAIPRNYYHTVINDGAIDWLQAGMNYGAVIAQAVDENDTHQSFVTEYAGTSSIVTGRLDYPGRFGDRSELAAITDAVSYVQYLTYNGYFTNPVPSQLLAILGRALPVPQKLVDQGITPGQYYGSMSYWVEACEMTQLDCPDLDLDFDPVALTDEITERIVTPTLNAGALLRSHGYLTRLFTMLSPDEMTRDPVFSFNPTLPDVSNVHEATLTYYCTSSAHNLPSTPAKIVTEQGFQVWLPNGTRDDPWATTFEQDMPRSRETQALREEGPPEVVNDRNAEVDSFSSDTPPDGWPDILWPPPPGGPSLPQMGHSGGGCQLSPLGTGSAAAILMLLAAGVALAFVRAKPPRN